MCEVRRAVAEALWGMCAADAMSMPVHWYYNTRDIRRDFSGWIRGLRAPRDTHPSSILSLSSTGQSAETLLHWLTLTRSWSDLCVIPVQLAADAPDPPQPRLLWWGTWFCTTSWGSGRIRADQCTTIRVTHLEPAVCPVMTSTQPQQELQITRESPDRTVKSAMLDRHSD